MTMFKTTLVTAIAVALGATALASTSVFAKVVVTTQSNARGNVSDSTPILPPPPPPPPTKSPSFQQILGNGPVKLLRRPITGPIAQPVCQPPGCAHLEP